MHVKFRLNPEPCIQYEVLQESVMAVDPKYGYCEHMELKVMGLVPAQLLTPTEHPDNVDAIDLFIELSK